MTARGVANLITETIGSSIGGVSWPRHDKHKTGRDWFAFPDIQSFATEGATVDSAAASVASAPNPLSRTLSAD